MSLDNQKPVSDIFEGTIHDKLEVAEILLKNKQLTMLHSIGETIKTGYYNNDNDNKAKETAGKLAQDTLKLIKDVARTGSESDKHAAMEFVSAHPQVFQIANKVDKAEYRAIRNRALEVSAAIRGDKPTPDR